MDPTLERHPARAPCARAWATALALTAVSAAGCGSGPSTSLTALSSGDGDELWGRADVLVGGAMETASDALAVVGYERCSSRGQLTVLDPASGATRWSVPVEGGFGPRSVALTGDLVVSSGSSDVRGLEIGDGSPRWTLSVAWPDPLVAADDESIAMAGLVQSPDRRSFTSHLSSVDPADGTTRWTVVFDAEQVIDLAVDDASVYVRLSGMSERRAGHTTVVTLDATDGAVRWSRDLGVSEIGTGLHLADETVVVNLLTQSWVDSAGVQLGPSSAVVALDRSDGVERWRIEGPVGDAAGAPGGSQAIAFDAESTTVIGRDGDGLVAWDGATGAPDWRLERSVSDAWIVDDLVLWSDEIGPDGDADRLHAADLGTGDERWSYAMSGLLRHVDAVDDTLFAAGNDSPSCD